MKIFVFSDSHLHTKYDRKFYEWVEYWSKQADKIIICGDFWDSDQCTFDEFIESEWKKEFFPLLKSKNTHYLYGNHDPEEKSDSRVNTFSKNQSHELDLDVGGRKLHFEHGNALCHGFDLSFLRKYGFLIQDLGFKIFGKNFLIVFIKNIWDLKRNWVGKDRFLICGHTHYSSKEENHFVMYPSAFGLQYGAFIDDEDIYEVNKYEKREQNINS